MAQSERIVRASWSRPTPDETQEYRIYPCRNICLLSDLLTLEQLTFDDLARGHEADAHPELHSALCHAGRRSDEESIANGKRLCEVLGDCAANVLLTHALFDIKEFNILMVQYQQTRRGPGDFRRMKEIGV
mmetsp:Transcript_1245/g.1743  ORF Transcript_1245/g.1743 Transcript_1245/m.1743 type:complete len:131 (-) Transcript_1245:575-967(-)